MFKLKPLGIRLNKFIKLDDYQKTTIFLIFSLVFFSVATVLLLSKLYFSTKNTVKPEGLKYIPTHGNLQTPIPQPNVITDWREYAIEAPEHIISEGDIVTKHWSPLNTYYLLHISPNKNWSTSLIAVYKADKSFVFSFNPKKSESSWFSGVAKRYTDYWINDHTIAFAWVDGDYNGGRGDEIFEYDLNTEQFKLAPDTIVDYDSVGGYLMARPSFDSWEKDLYYVDKNKVEIYLGKHKGIVNGISPSGKYIVLLGTKNGDNESKYDDNGIAPISVFISKTEPNSISDKVMVGNTRMFQGGIEGIADYPWTTWSSDEKKFTVNYFLTESKEFINSF